MTCKGEGGGTLGNILSHLPMAVPTPIAIISPVPTPYRVHFHRRIARELPVTLHSLFTHDDAVSGPSKWRMDMPPEIGAVFFEGDLLTSNSGDLPRQWRLFKRICAFLVEKNIELVILDGYADFTRLLLLRWAKARNLPVVLRGDSNIHSETGLPKWKKFLKKRVVGWAIQKAAGLMPMGACGQAYFDLYGGQLKPSFICPYEPDYAAIEGVTPQQRTTFCVRHHLDAKRKRFLYCGRLVPQKRVEVALDAFLSIAKAHPDWDLVLAGDGPLRAQLAARVPVCMRPRVKFLGFLQMNETVACYQACHCLLLPSDYEPWALVINEACAAGLAIVATEVVGAAVELVEDGNNGYLVPPGDTTRFAAAMAQVSATPKNWHTASRFMLAQWQKKADPVAAVALALAKWPK